MNQEIGISFTAKGADRVITDVNRIGSSLDTLLQKSRTVAEQMGVTASRFSTLTANASPAVSVMKDVSQALGSVTGTARAANQAVGSLNNALATAKGLNPAKIMGNFGGPGGSRPGSQGFLGSGWGPGGFMARFMAFHEALRGLRYGLVDVGMGRARVAMDEALAELSAINFNRMQKTATEEAAHKYAQRFPNVSAPDYIKAMSQTGSAFSVDKLGMAQMQQMNEAAIMMGKMGKLKPEAAAEMQSKLLNQYIASLGSGAYNSLQSGGRADVRGFGNVNIGEMAQKYAAMVGKTIEISSIWSKGIQDFMQYAGPVMAQQKWDPAQMLSYVGTMADVGFKGAKSGRAMKDILLNTPEGFARMMMADEGRLTPGAKGLQKQQQDQDVRRRAAEIRGQIAAGKFTQFLEANLPRIMGYASKLSRDPKWGMSLVKDFGLSKDFIPQIMALAQQGTIERLKQQEAQIRGATPEELQRKNEESVSTVGHSWKRLGTAMERYTSAISKSEGPLSTALSGLTGLLNKGAEGAEKQNRIADLSRFIEEKRARFGPGMRVKPGEEGNFFSTEDVRREINAWGKEQYLTRMKGVPKPGADASEYEKWQYSDRKRKIHDDILNEMKGAWFNTTNPANIYAEERMRPAQRLGNGLIGIAEALEEGMKKIRAAVGLPAEPPSKPEDPEMVAKRQSERKTMGNIRELDPWAQAGGINPDAAAASGQQPPPQIKVFIGDREIKDMVIEVLDWIGTTARVPWGSGPFG